MAKETKKKKTCDLCTLFVQIDPKLVYKCSYKQLKPNKKYIPYNTQSDMDSKIKKRTVTAFYRAIHVLVLITELRTQTLFAAVGQIPSGGRQATVTNPVFESLRTRPLVKVYYYYGLFALATYQNPLGRYIIIIEVLNNKKKGKRREKSTSIVNC